MCFFVVIAVLLDPSKGNFLAPESENVVEQCEPVKLELCPHYKHTGMPNLMGHQLQGDAKAGMETFLPLLQYGCSPELQFFLCSVHAPMCESLPPKGDTKEPVHQLIGPCRPLCQRVKDACLMVLQNFDLDWPESLDCDRFPPANNDLHMCMDGGNGTGVGMGSGSSKNPNLPGNPFSSLAAYPELLEKYSKVAVEEKPELSKYQPLLNILKHRVNIQPAKGYQGRCTQVAFPVQHHYLNRTGVCVPRCGENILFDSGDKSVVSMWLWVMSCLCLASTSLILITFLLEPQRFSYPERCLVFLAFSYLLTSLGHILHLVLGPEAVSCVDLPGTPVSLLLTAGLPPSPGCTIVFLLLYFSSLSAAIWWALTTITWSLSIALALPPSNLLSRAPILHCLGWGLPAAQTLANLILHHVEGDELTGLCLPGQQTDSILLHHLAIPLSVYLASACIAYLAGLVASLVQQSERSRKLLPRISFFFLLYTVPQVYVVGSLLYELIERSGWKADASNRPSLEIFILRIFMQLIVGTILVSLVLSHKSLNTWKKLATKCFGFWSGAKKPPTPIFPKVAFKPQSLQEGLGPEGEGLLTLHNLATIKQSNPLTLQLLHPPHNPQPHPHHPPSHRSGGYSTGQDHRVVLGSVQECRVVL